MSYSIKNTSNLKCKYLSDAKYSRRTQSELHIIVQQMHTYLREKWSHMQTSPLLLKPELSSQGKNSNQDSFRCFLIAME